MRCPSANRVSKASDDFPEPDKPVITTSLFRGMATLRFLRLFTLAPLMIIKSRGSSSSIGAGRVEGIRLFIEGLNEPAKHGKTGECWKWGMKIAKWVLIELHQMPMPNQKLIN
jgi:hypothetical protein